METHWTNKHSSFNLSRPIFFIERIVYLSWLSYGSVTKSDKKFKSSHRSTRKVLNSRMVNFVFYIFEIQCWSCCILCSSSLRFPDVAVHLWASKRSIARVHPAMWGKRVPWVDRNWRNLLVTVLGINSTIHREWGESALGFFHCGSR